MQLALPNILYQVIVLRQVIGVSQRLPYQRNLIYSIYNVCNRGFARFLAHASVDASRWYVQLL